MKNIMAVLGLYRERRLLLTLMSALVLILPFGHTAAAQGHWALFDSLTTIWLCLWMTVAFQLGVMVKRQLVSPMAGLLPGYRRAHILVAVIIWGVVAVLIGSWVLALQDICGDRVKSAWIFLCLGTYLATLVIAYISERRILFIGYGLLLLTVNQTRDLLHFLVISDPVYYGLTGLAVMVLGGFIWRLASLKEGMAEFGCVLSWPLHRARTAAPVRAYVPRPAPLFVQQKSLIARAFHWAYVEAEDIPGIIGILSAGVLIFTGYVVFIAGPTGFYTRPYANFLIFAVLPLAVMLCFCYRTVSFRDYALLRPLRREELALQWGVFLTIILTGAWGIIAVVFGILPAVIWHLPFIVTPQFWVYLVFTGVFAQMTLACLMYVAALKDQWRAVSCVVFYTAYVLVEFMNIPGYSLPVLLWHLTLAVVLCIFLAVMTYRRWCHEEV